MTATVQHPRSLYLLASLPALAVGVLVMRASGVSAGVWEQNLAAWVVGAVLCLFVWRARPSASPVLADLTVLLTAAALMATLLAPGVDGVHRWVRIGPVSLHTAALLLPVMLIALERVERARGWWLAALAAMGVTLILLLQPDAAQATAFAVAAAMILVLPGARESVPRSVALLAPLVMAGLSWLRRDPLEPVPHVEGIVGLAGSLGAGWAVAAVAALLLLPAPFLLGGGRAAQAAGIYLIITTLAALVGNFPVPMMGYGASPILGCLLALAACQPATVERPGPGLRGELPS